MFLKAIVIIVVLKLIRSQVIFCSSFCQQSSCTGFGPTDCTNCNTGAWGWALSGSTCALTAASNKQIIDVSDDFGGSITVTSTPVSTDCSALPVPFYGSFTASMPVNVYLPGGSILPRGHWGFDLIYEVIMVDVYGAPLWDVISKMYTSLDFATPPQNKSASLDINNPAATQLIYCGNPGKRDKFFQIKQTFTHNQSGVDINFTIKSDNSNGGSKWVCKEFILVAKLCNFMCLTCFGSLETQCTSCDAAGPFLLNNLTCSNSCLAGFGYTTDPSICVWCNLKCQSSACFGIFDNCTSCSSSGTWASFLYVNSSAGYLTCESNCPAGQFGNSTARTCDLCNPICTKCSINDSHCQECITGYGWYNHQCFQPCNQGFYSSNNSKNCTKCNVTCSACLNQSICTSCNLNGTNMAFLLNSTCYKTCPSTYYSSNNNGAGPNLCLSCDPSCSTCTDNPNPCQSCFSGYYLFNSSCGTTCPSPYIAYALWNKCVDCSVYCVDLTINMYFPEADNYQMYIDMIFTDSIDFTTFDCLAFQNISIENQQITSFTITNITLSASSYRIIIQSVGFIFLYNNTVTVMTMTQPSVIHTAINLLPFKTTNYGRSATLNWFLIKSPGTTDLQRKIINTFSTISDTFARATTHPVLVYVKKAGVLAMVVSGAQMTSLSVLVNSVPPQNMYEAVRIWGIFVFYDVPRWQQNSGIPNHVLGPDTYDLVKNERRLFDLTTLPWRFQRIGYSSFFIYDVYVPMILIVTCWVLFLAAYLVRNHMKLKYLQGKFFSIMHKIHELASLYVTIAMMLQWMYFDGASSKRWISLVVCVLFNIYFIGYHLYIYYDMINYPLAVIGNDRYQYYLTRYSSFLKNLRFEQYNIKQEWSIRHWLRPYNYHLFSYYKKFCLIIAMPLFYGIKHVQAAILLIIQAFQIVRYIGTRPYYSCWRFYFRLWLQICILLFFIVVLVSTFLIDGVTANDSDTLFFVKIFNAMGWFGFCLVFSFNIGFLLLMIVDIVQGFKFTNRQILDQARRIYYYDKLLEQQKQMENIPLGQINRLVKFGNLNMRNNQNLPNINLRIQMYRIVPRQEYYQVELIKTVDLFMNIDLNYNSENNTTVGSCIKKKFKLTTEVSTHMFKTINWLFKQHRRKNIEAITIKTFVKIGQRNFRAGDKIPLIKEHMTQKIELQNINGQKSIIKLKSILAGFPIDSYLLQKL